MPRPPARVLSDVLGQLLLRETRARLHADLVAGIDGVDVTTYPVLSGLARVGDRTASQLAQEIGLDRSVTSRHLSALEHAGLVRRHVSPTDHRAVAVALTAQGQAAVDEMRARLESRLNAFLGRYPADRRADLVDMLSDLTDYLRGQ